MDEPHQPEHEDKGGEKHGIESFEKLFTELDLPVFVSFPSCPGYSLLSPVHFLLRLLSECLDEGLHQDVHEGFEEAEDQPAVQHLDVGGGWEVGAHTHIKNIL